MDLCNFSYLCKKEPVSSLKWIRVEEEISTSPTAKKTLKCLNLLKCSTFGALCSKKYCFNLPLLDMIAFMNGTERIRHYLQEQLIERLKTNPQYSQRAFAKSLGLSSGQLSEILNNKRTITLKLLNKIVDRLSLSKTDEKYLYNAFLEKESSEDSKYEILTADLFHIVSDWYCFAILNLADCEGFRWSLSWISKKLGISILQAKDAMERMTRVGLITKTEKSYIKNHDFVFSPDGVPSTAIKKFHQQMLKKAEQSLTLNPVNERDISGIGFAVDPKEIDSIKKEIYEFQDRIIQKYNTGNKTKVYHLECALFELTQGATIED